ncbi:unnamed protein product [Schistocephalus solidus]|uniref:Uncharacterized protein n=1 Tax=Schistocephalus solidus TaxID=70667 RepID=A0A183TEZ1_SCHSO|nr:unnamed protein product [Schistocephalus solidus]
MCPGVWEVGRCNSSVVQRSKPYGTIREEAFLSSGVKAFPGEAIRYFQLGPIIVCNSSQMPSLCHQATVVEGGTQCNEGTPMRFSVAPASDA